MTQGGPGYASQILPTYSYTLAFTGFNMGKAAAVSGVLMIIPTVLTLSISRPEIESYETY